MPYNLRQRYNLRDRPSAIQKAQPKGQAAVRQPRSKKKGARRGKRSQNDKDITPSLAEPPRDEQQHESPPGSAYNQMHPWLKEVGYEPGPFIYDPENGLKEGEKPRTPEIEIDEDESPFPDIGIEIDPAFREASKYTPMLDAWMKGWDRMHLPKGQRGSRKG